MDSLLICLFSQLQEYFKCDITGTMINKATFQKPVSCWWYKQYALNMSSNTPSSASEVFCFNTNCELAIRCSCSHLGRSDPKWSGVWLSGGLYAINLRSSVRVSSSSSSRSLAADKKSHPRKCTSRFTLSHFLLQNYGKQVQTNLHVRPPLVRDHQSKTPKLSQSKPYSWNL